MRAAARPGSFVSSISETTCWQAVHPNSIQMRPLNSFLVTLALCACFLPAVAQKVGYTVTNTDTELPFVSLAAVPLNLDMAFSTHDRNAFGAIERSFSGFGWSITANPIGPLIVNYERSGSQLMDAVRWSLTSSVASPANITEESFVRSNYSDLGAEWTFVNKEVDNYYRLALSSTTSGNYTTTKYINVLAKARKVWSLRGGMARYRKSYMSDNVVASDSTVFTGNRAYPPNDAQSIRGSGDEWWYTQRTTAFYGGIGYQIYGNIEANTDYGYRKTSTNTRFFADVMMTASNTVKLDFEDNTYTVLETNQEDKALFPTSNIGYRFGIDRELGGRRAGIAVRLEVGKRPEYGGYMKFDFAVPINFFRSDVGI